MSKTKKKLNLALQGGGSHGAFTWGVLEKLFEENVFDITAICGTSAGAVNACIAVDGYQKGGNKGAIEQLNIFWEKLAAATAFWPVQPSLIDKMVSGGNMEFSPGYNVFSLVSNFFSPYQWNPFDLNLLRDLLTELVDFDCLKKSEIKLITCATNVKTGQAKVFDPSRMDVDRILASACLPTLFKAVEIDGEYYWDGGFMGNPPLYPLIKATSTSDILLVQINPCRIHKVPTTADAIAHRINELSFNSSLIWELRLIEFKNEMLAKGFKIDGQYRHIRYHTISADNALEEFDVSSKANTSIDFLKLLKSLGREYAEVWLKNNYDKVGNKTSANFAKEMEHEFIG